MPCELMTETMNRTRHDTTRHDTTRHDTTRRDTVGEKDAPRAFISARHATARKKAAGRARPPSENAGREFASGGGGSCRAARAKDRALRAIDPTIASVTPVVVERRAQVARGGREWSRSASGSVAGSVSGDESVLASAYARVPERVRGYR